MRESIASLLFIVLCGVSVANVWAAKRIDLRHQPMTMSLSSFAAGPVAIKEISRRTDKQHNVHIRVQEIYAGYRVWGGDAIVHQYHSSGQRFRAMKQRMNGFFYQDLAMDLQNTPAFVFNAAQANKAAQAALALFQQQSGRKVNANPSRKEIIVYIDKQSKAHYAYIIGFDLPPAKPTALPQKPVFIIDAVNLTRYEQWDDIQTATECPASETSCLVDGGGLGANRTVGRVYYDGLTKSSHYSKLTVTRKQYELRCFMKNNKVTVKRYRTGEIVSYLCFFPDGWHNNVFWDDDYDYANGGYSPANDVLYGGQVVVDMYQKWYDMPVLARNGKPMMLFMRIHVPMVNAYWDGRQMSFGDGDANYYPLTTLDVTAHEVSHGFTQQHSDLAYYGQSGGINESFSDMAAQAAIYYATRTNNWQIGAGLEKSTGRPFRYMDTPSRDGRSIETADDYTDDLDVHYSSGVFNKAFYLLSTTPSWNTHKAFDVMVHANAFYWSSLADYTQAACGAVYAAQDLSYDVEAVRNVFTKVGINTSEC